MEKQMDLSLYPSSILCIFSRLHSSAFKSQLFTMATETQHRVPSSVQTPPQDEPPAHRRHGSHPEPSINCTTHTHTHTPNTVIFPCNLAALVQIKISVCFWSVTFSRLRRVYVDLHKNLSAIFKQKLQLSIKLELHILTSSVSVSHYQLPNIPNTSVFGLSLLASSQRETEREV